MRLASGDVRATSFHTKTTTDHRIGATGLCCSRDVKKSISRNFGSRSIFDFCNSRHKSDQPFRPLDGLNRLSAASRENYSAEKASCAG